MVHGRRGFLKFQCRFHWTLSASTHHCSVARSFQVCCCRSASSDNRTTARAREKVLFSSPTLVDIWQMHFLLLSGQEIYGAWYVHRELIRCTPDRHA